MTLDPMSSPDTEPDDPSTVVVAVVSPWCTSVIFPLSGGDTLTITRKGVDVPTEDADALIQTAAEHGVTLAKVS